MSVVAVVVFGGSRGNLVPSQVAIRRVVAWVGDTSVEALLPKGGRSLQLPCSGGSSVSGVHADGGTPDGDFTKEGRGRVAARRCPHRLCAVLGSAGAGSGRRQSVRVTADRVGCPWSYSGIHAGRMGRMGEQSRGGQRCMIWPHL